MGNETMLTTPQVAEKLGVTTARVRQLILEGRLPSQQFGRDHLIRESDLALVADRKTGRPPQKVEAKTNGAKKAASASGRAKTSAVKKTAAKKRSAGK